MQSLFSLARMDRARDPRVGQGFWLDSEAERAVRRDHLKAVQGFAGRDVGTDDFHVRGMLVCNTQRDYYYSRFSREALNEVAELLPGAPAMYAHDYGSQPVGRIFSARVVRIEDADLPQREQHWVEALYYVPRDEGGDAHIRRVDLGVYREVSLGWRVVGQDCSVCGDSILRCTHIPGDIYDKRGICEYEFSGITAGLEVSHVFRGGQKDTTTFVPEGAGDPMGAAAMRAFAPGTRDVDPALLITAKRHNGALVSKPGQTLEEWLRGDAGQRAVGMGVWFFGQPGERDNTQAIHVRKDRFASVARAKRWARDHDFRVDRLTETADSLVFTQHPETRFAPGAYRTIKLESGIEARVGKPAQPGAVNTMGGRALQQTGGDDPLATWLSAGSHGA